MVLSYESEIWKEKKKKRTFQGSRLQNVHNVHYPKGLGTPGLGRYADYKAVNGFLPSGWLKGVGGVGGGGGVAYKM